MQGIFLSYRRADTQGWAGRLQQSLRASFGDVPLFYDLDAIAPGADFPARIEGAVAACRALLALIGPHWLDEVDGRGRRRLNDPKDYVRREIALGLRRRILVVPILLGGAGMPKAARLPAGLKALSRRNAHELSDKRWAYDFEVLAKALARDTGLKLREDAGKAAAAQSVEVARDLTLREVEMRDIAGVQTSAPGGAPPGRVEAARGARITRSKVRDIVGVKVSPRRKSD